MDHVECGGHILIHLPRRRGKQCQRLDFVVLVFLDWIEITEIYCGEIIVLLLLQLLQLVGGDEFCVQRRAVFGCFQFTAEYTFGRSGHFYFSMDRRFEVGRMVEQ